MKILITGVTGFIGGQLKEITGLKGTIYWHSLPKDLGEFQK